MTHNKRIVDYTKLATFIELLPSLPLRRVLDVIKEFRSHERARYADIDPAEYDNNYAFNLIDNPYLEYFGRAVLVTHLASILRTPRGLKAALRRTRHVWASLHGEVDFDELLVINALRASDRMVAIGASATDSGMAGRSNKVMHVFDLVMLHADFLRDIGRGEPNKNVITEEQQVLLSLVKERDRDAEGAMIAFLFPPLGTHEYVIPGRPQSVANQGPTNYLERMMAEELGNEVSDQAVLRKCRSWSEGGSVVGAAGSLARMLLEDVAEAEKVIQFKRVFDRKELLQLADETVGLVLADPSSAVRDDDGHVRGMINVAKLFLGSESRDGRIDLICRWIKNAMGQSLTVAHQIEYWLVLRFSEHLPYMPDSLEARSRVATTVREAFIESFVNATATNRLVAALPNDQPFIYSYLIRRAWDRDSESPVQDIDGWRLAAKVMVDAARCDRRYGGQALAVLLASPSDALVGDKGNLGWQSSFDERFAEELLGDCLDEALRVLATVPIDGLEGQGRAYARAVVDYARSYVENEGNSVA